MAAKGKYNEETVRQIEQCLETGLSSKKTCFAVDIDPSTYYGWINNTPKIIWECNCKVIWEDLLGKENEINKTYIRPNIPKDKYCKNCKSKLVKKPNFNNRVKKAKLKGQQKKLSIIEKAADKKWQAAAWLLERMYPSEYALWAKDKPKEEEQIDTYEEYRKKYKGEQE